MVGKMYPDTKTWNPFLGCLYDCVYCESSFKKVLRWISRRNKCQDCRDYRPHEHPERLRTSSIPSAPEKLTVFVFGQGDITFCRPAYVLKTFQVIMSHRPKIRTSSIPSAPEKLTVFVFGQGDITFCRPAYVLKTFQVIMSHRPKIRKEYYWQSKNPKCLEQYIGKYPQNSTLVTTLETNRDEGYERVSKAPVPSVRFKDFYELEFPRKVVTIEPVMDFDLDEFLEWILRLKDQGSLQYVWFGYNSNPEAVQLPEPSEEKSQEFVNLLMAAGIEVRGKSLRGVVV